MSFIQMKIYIHCFQVIMCLTIICNKHIGNTKIEILHCRDCFFSRYFIVYGSIENSEMKPPTGNGLINKGKS